MVHSSDISVVIQGPSCDEKGVPFASLIRTISSIRDRLPEAEIILSTWQGGHLADHWKPHAVVLSEDPGGMRYRSDHPFENNVNRQIRSTLAGLRRVTRPYSLKLRSDLILTGTGFLDGFERFPGRLSVRKLFQRRVATCSTFTVEPRHGNLALFHPSDWAHFGLTQDLIFLWDVAEAEEESMMRWFERHRPDWQALISRFGIQSKWRHAATSALRTHRQLFESGFACRYAPEQYLWISALRKAGYNGFLDAIDFSEATIDESVLWLVNNLVILQPDQFGIASLKYDVRLEQRSPRLYTHFDWCRLYRKSTGDRLAAPLPGWLFPFVQSRLARVFIPVAERLGRLWSRIRRMFGFRSSL
jgi:hypothetical protein